MKQTLAAFARNTVFANIVLVLIFVAGFIASANMIRETFPEFSLDMITISVPYPGADPEEVEEGISRKIEEAIEGVEGIKQYTTESSEGGGTANIGFSKTMPWTMCLTKSVPRSMPFQPFRWMLKNL